MNREDMVGLTLQQRMELVRFREAMEGQSKEALIELCLDTLKSYMRVQSHIRGIVEQGILQGRTDILKSIYKEFGVKDGENIQVD